MPIINSNTNTNRNNSIVSSLNNLAVDNLSQDQNKNGVIINEIIENNSNNNNSNSDNNNINQASNLVSFSNGLNYNKVKTFKFNFYPNLFFLNKLFISLTKNENDTYDNNNNNNNINDSSDKNTDFVDANLFLNSASSIDSNNLHSAQQQTMPYVTSPSPNSPLFPNSNNALSTMNYAGNDSNPNNNIPNSYK